MPRIKILTSWPQAQALVLFLVLLPSGHVLSSRAEDTGFIIAFIYRIAMRAKFANFFLLFRFELNFGKFLRYIF